MESTGFVDRKIPKEFYTTDEEARRYSLQIVVCNVLIYLWFLMALVGYAPWWSGIPTIFLLLPRWMIAVHELFHVRGAFQVNYFIYLLPMLLTPLNVGYREYQDIHFRHHRYMCTPQDPDFYHIRGNKIAAFLNALTAPEQSFFRWLSYKGADFDFIRDSFIRCTLFLALVGFSGTNFLWYWLPLRATHAVNYFTFFYGVHRKEEEYGVYPLNLPVPIERFFTFVFGRQVVLSVKYHDVHHSLPTISILHLEDVTAKSAGTR